MSFNSDPECDHDTPKDWMFTYNKELDKDIWLVMEHLNEGLYLTEISSKTQLSEKYIELIQHVLCREYLADYGTSPRGCWLSKKGEIYLDKFRESYKNDF